MDGKKAQVFISYSWKDQTAAKAIEKALEGDPLLAQDLSVWRDQSALRPGDHISSKIADALKATDYFVLLLSESSVASAWVKREIATAVDLADKKKLTAVPVLLSEVEVPFEFRGLLYIDGRSSVAEAVNKVIEFFQIQRKTIATIEPHEMLLKSRDDGVQARLACQKKLRELRMQDLRYHLSERLSLSEIQVLWYDVFERKMQDDVNVQGVASCCVELLDRSRREDVLVELIDAICRNHPRISRSL